MNIHKPYELTRLLLVITLSVMTFSSLASTSPATVTDLQLEIDDLQQRVIQLEQQLSAVLKLVSHDDNPVSNIPTEKQIITVKENKKIKEASITVGGRVKVDAIYNSRAIGESSNTNRNDLIFSPGNIPLDGSGEKDQFNFSARETRLWVTANVPTELGELGGHVEMDFFSSDTSGSETVTNSYLPRLRHAYANYADFTAGQTWTTFMNVSAIPDKNDLGGPSGILLARQPLLRYRHKQEWGSLSVALEQAESTLMTSAGSRIASDDERFPDVIAKVEFNNNWGNWSVAGLLRQVRSDNNGLDDASWGGAINASGRIYTNGVDNVRFALSYGNALGRYMSLNSFADGIIDDNGKIELTEMFGGYIAYQHWWSEKLRSNLTFGYSQANHDLTAITSLTPVIINESLFSSHVNLLWSPTTAATVGVEWIHGQRNLEDGRDGELDRIQFTSMFRF